METVIRTRTGDPRITSKIPLLSHIGSIASAPEIRRCRSRNDFSGGTVRLGIGLARIAQRERRDFE
jgi:hypothetical protein